MAPVAVTVMTTSSVIQSWLAIVWLVGSVTAGAVWLTRVIAKAIRRHRLLTRLERMAW